MKRKIIIALLGLTFTHLSTISYAQELSAPAEEVPQPGCLNDQGEDLCVLAETVATAARNLSKFEKQKFFTNTILSSEGKTLITTNVMPDEMEAMVKKAHDTNGNDEETKTILTQNMLTAACGGYPLHLILKGIIMRYDFQHPDLTPFVSISVGKIDCAVIATGRDPYAQ
jgi:hypothetical protein